MDVPLLAPLLRGAALLGGFGALLGAVAGTVGFPIVGTSAGALEAGIFGGLVGVADGVVLIAVVRIARSRSLARAASATVVGAAVLLAALDVDWDLRSGPVLATLGASVAVAALFGPLIAFGAQPGVRDPRWPGSAIQRVTVLCVGLGAVAGGVIGLVRGLDYVPTAVFALIEGALIGAPCGFVLAAAIVAIAVLPRVRARR